MDREIWHQLLPLENRDITRKWFNKIHGRELNVRRAKEINAAAKQAREYFRNADNSDYSVRPLLTFYGVSSLSRSLLLLLKRDGGEEKLTSGHGLNTVDWSGVLSGDLSTGLGSLLNLKVQTCSGLFGDFIRETQNRISIHVRSSGVDWRLNYDIPELGVVISLGDLFSRMPDLFKDYSVVSSDIRYAYINDILCDQQNGFKVKVRNDHFDDFKDIYQNMGYKIETQEQWSIMTCDAETFGQNLPIFIHSYIHKSFEAIPNLYIAEPFHDQFAFSQLCITYIVAYYLGMLARYYPTHWMALLQGETGDVLWPTVNKAQQLVESSYPELVVEMIADILKES